MTIEYILERVIDILVNNGIEKKENINRDSKLIRDLRMNEREIINLLMTIEEEFNIGINRVGELITVEDIVLSINEKVNHPDCNI